MKIKLKKFNKKIEKVDKLICDFLEDLIEISPKDSAINVEMKDIDLDEKSGIVYTELTFKIPITKLKK